MLTYKVEYRAPTQEDWITLKNAIDDGETATGQKYIQLKNDRQIHIPMNSEIHFGPERMKVIKKRMSKDAGLKLERS